MENPFKILDARLKNIENMILEMRYPSLAQENRNANTNTSSEDSKSVNPSQRIKKRLKASNNEIHA